MENRPEFINLRQKPNIPPAPNIDSQPDLLNKNPEEKKDNRNDNTKERQKVKNQQENKGLLIDTTV